MNYDQIPSQEIVTRTANSLRAHGFDVAIVNTKEEALELVKQTIPQGASVMNGSSKTVTDIGYTDYLKVGQHDWKNFHEEILAEKDPKKQSRLRKESSLADYFISGANAISETGEIIIASGTGSQLPGITYNSDNVILIVGTHKITPTLEDGLVRLRTYVVPLEDAKMKAKGYPGTLLSKILIYEKHPAGYGKNVLVILVNEKLGF